MVKTEEGRRNSVSSSEFQETLTIIVNIQVTKNLILVAMHFCFFSFFR